MKLYRARLTSQRPRRHPAFAGNNPEARAMGRWFTSDIEAARLHGESNLSGGDWEIIEIDVRDDIAQTYQVAVTPKTRCGLTPVDFAIDPQNEYLVPIWIAMAGQVLSACGTVRQRDYLFQDANKSQRVKDIADSYGLPVSDIKMAA